MDLTPLIHAVIAVTAQLAVGKATGNWWLGGLLACIWWIAREHTQAEYRWIQTFAGGRRMGMPWWGGFDPRVWSWASGLDALAPALFCLLLFIATKP